MHQLVNSLLLQHAIERVERPGGSQEASDGKKWYCSCLHFCFDADVFQCRSRPRKNRSLQKLYKKQLAGLVRLQKPSKAEAAHRFVVFAS